MVEDAVVRQHADEDVEESGVDVRNNSNLLRGYGPASPGHHQGRNGQGLVEENEQNHLERKLSCSSSTTKGQTSNQLLPFGQKLKSIIHY